MRLGRIATAVLLIVSSLTVNGNRQFHLRSMLHPMLYRMVRLPEPAPFSGPSPLAVVVAVPPPPQDYDAVFEDLPPAPPVGPILPPAPRPRQTPPLLESVVPPQAEAVKEFSTGEGENANARYLSYGKN